MFGILNTLEQWLKDLLISFITSNLTNLFDDVNTKVDTIASEVNRTPATWNASIFAMIRNLSNIGIVPIAGIIITFVLCYDLMCPNIYSIMRAVLFPKTPIPTLRLPSPQC